MCHYWNPFSSAMRKGCTEKAIFQGEFDRKHAKKNINSLSSAAYVDRIWSAKFCTSSLQHIFWIFDAWGFWHWWRTIYIFPSFNYQKNCHRKYFIKDGSCVNRKYLKRWWRSTFSTSPFNISLRKWLSRKYRETWLYVSAKCFVLRKQKSNFKPLKGIDFQRM